MKLQSLDFQKLAGITLCVLASIVLMGWAVGSMALVRGFAPNSPAMAINTALLFFACGVYLIFPPRPGRVSLLHPLCAGLLVLLPSAVLIEHLFGVDLGIDLASLQRAVKDTNPWPGRMAPNSAVGFICTGLALSLLNRPPHDSRIRKALSALIVLVLTIGGLAMLGHVLKLEVIYQIASYNSMAVPTALGFTLLGVALWDLERQIFPRSAYSFREEDKRITGYAIMVLTVLAIAAGLSGFAVLRQDFEESAAKQIKSTAKSDATLITNEIDQALVLSKVAVTRPPILDLMEDLNTYPDDARKRAALTQLANSFLRQGYDGLQFFNARGVEVASAGWLNADKASVAIRLIGPENATLLWQNGFLLQTMTDVMRGDKNIGKIVIEHRLHQMTDMSNEMQKLGNSNDMVLCGRDKDEVACFPSRFYEANQRAPMFDSDGSAKFAIARALLGNSGSAEIKDLRGVMVLAGYAPLSGYGLGLVLKADIQEIYAPLRERFNFLIVLLIIFVAIGTFLLRTRMQPLINAQLSEKERLRVTLNSIGDAVITTDTAGNVVFLNPVAETLTGWNSAQAVGVPLSSVFQIIDEKTGALTQNPVHGVLADKLYDKKLVTLIESTVLIQRGGARIAIENSAAPIRDLDDRIIGVVLVFRDVSAVRKMAVEMVHQATHDALTGLINRHEFERRLETALRSGAQAETQHTLLYIDLDQFKVVNDTCGHMAGDELLRQLTGVLNNQLRHSDTLARLGGDEFGVLLENCGVDPAMRIAELLRQTASDFQFVWQQNAFPVSLSIGLVTFGNTGESKVDILRLADAACYVAKDKGRNRIHVCAPEDEALAKRNGEMGWIGKIQKALDEDRLVLYSQKILGLGSGMQAEEHYEMLLRMMDEEGRLVPPIAFIPAAERYGMMPTLDRWVIKEALSQYTLRHPPGSVQGVCAINLSGTSICDEHLIGFVRKQFEITKVAPSAICFEVTETAAISNLTQAAGLIRELKALGSSISLDDFGSGMSSFAYLKHLPVDYLKIDGGFVKDMMHDPIDHAMVESINHIGHVMGLKTIAEFVENDVILEELRRMGIDYAQGYGVEKPKAFSRPAV